MKGKKQHDPTYVNSKTWPYGSPSVRITMLFNQTPACLNEIQCFVTFCLLVSAVLESTSVIGAAVGSFVAGAIVVIVAVFVWLRLRTHQQKQSTDTR